ncbi:MAG TPA: hypothetical protein VI248_13075 [Kineosporiaceae bacterium]
MRSTPERPTDPDHPVLGIPDRGAELGMPILPRVGEHAGFTVARLALMVAAGVGLDRLLSLSQDRAWAVLAVITVLALVPAARISPALAGAGTTWLLGTGFVTNRFGELTLTDSDLGHLALMTLTAIVAVLVSRWTAANR